MVENLRKRGLKKGLKLGGNRHKLTSYQKEILHLLTEEFLTVKQVSTLKKCSLQAIYKIRDKLIIKGFLNANIPKKVGVEKKGGVSSTFQPPKHWIRLHAEQFVLKILARRSTKPTYKSGSTVKVGVNTVRLNKHSVEIYSNTSFFGVSSAVADSKALSFWFVFINRLEQRFKITLLKEGYLNFSRVRQEYAEVGNELAKKLVEESQKIHVVGSDGKQWLVFDNSFKLHEAETVHPLTARDDMADVVKPFFNDLRFNPSTFSEVKSIILDLTKQNMETAEGLKAVVDVLGLILGVNKNKIKDSVCVVDKDSREWYYG